MPRGGRLCVQFKGTIVLFALKTHATTISFIFSIFIVSMKPRSSPKFNNLHLKSQKYFVKSGGFKHNRSEFRNVRLEDSEQDGLS